MLLNGQDLADYIKERQVHAVRGASITPVLAAVISGGHKPSEKYVALKQSYGEDIGIEVQVHRAEANQQDILQKIKQLNEDDDVHGIIVQLPLPEGFDTDVILNAIAPEKDVDGLGAASAFDAAAPMAILWLLGGYAVELKGKEILVIGQGRLVGAPLTAILKDSGYSVDTADESTTDLKQKALAADIIITATGSPGLIRKDMVKKGGVVIDAGTAEAGGKLVGDADPALYDEPDIKISPVPGGVGPLTVAVLFEHVIRAARG